MADLTYLPTWAGFLYLAVVIDVYSRRVVGWAFAATLHTKVVLDALDMALQRRRPRDVIHHSDQGSQYTSIAFGNRCRKAGVRPSMGSVGDCYDNAMAESFFATLECELLDRVTFKTHAEARRAVFAFIEGFYNPRRRHSSLGYLSPADFERSQAVHETADHPDTHHPATVLGPVKARPGNAGTSGHHTLPADLDGICARRHRCHVGRDERMGSAGAEHGVIARLLLCVPCVNTRRSTGLMSKRIRRQAKVQQHQYVGLDVSLAETAIAVVDESSNLLWRGKVDSTPEAIAEALQVYAPHAERVGLEAGQLSSWLYQSLKALELPVICVDARHAKAALSLRLNKTDPNDALGLAEIMRVGWYREVVVKGQAAQSLRALLVARAQLVSQVTTLKNCVRGLLKVYGIVLAKKLRASFVANVREAVAGHATLEPVLDPIVRTLSATIEQLHVYDRAVSRHARDDETIRHLMTAPGVGPIVAMAYVTAVDTPARFARSSSVGVYFGMTPRRYQSGEVDTAGRISRCGDSMVRGLLFEAAKVLLARSAKPSDLQAWGRKLARRIGKKKATVAVARKLSVVLHRMWTTGEPFRWTTSLDPATA